MESREIGRGENCVVFLHGWGGDASAFSFVAKQLRGFRCLLVDFDGFGCSPEPPVPFTVGDYAKNVLDEMKKCGIESAAVVGHSFGGRVALEIAAYNPSIVSALALVDSAGLRPKRKITYYAKILAHKLLIFLGLNGLKGSADYRILSPVMKKTFKNVVNYDQTKILPKITCPTALFWGKTDDQTPPYMAKKFQKHIADSSIFWLNGGHFAYVEDFKRFLAVLTVFLEKTAVKRSENSIDEEINSIAKILNTQEDRAFSGDKMG